MVFVLMRRYHYIQPCLEVRIAGADGLADVLHDPCHKRLVTRKGTAVDQNVVRILLLAGESHQKAVSETLSVHTYTGAEVLWTAWRHNRIQRRRREAGFLSASIFSRSSLGRNGLLHNLLPSR